MLLSGFVYIMQYVTIEDATTYSEASYLLKIVYKINEQYCLWILSLWNRKRRQYLYYRRADNALCNVYRYNLQSYTPLFHQSGRELMRMPELPELCQYARKPRVSLRIVGQQRASALECVGDTESHTGHVHNTEMPIHY